MQQVTYDGTPESVRRITDLIGSKGVNNTPDGYCVIPAIPVTGWEDETRFMYIGDRVINHKRGPFLYRKKKPTP